ncbi:MAG: hypothetical protein K2Y01_08110 [Rhabdochlamydiaceae bacterium]|nr:hypothetical protein [Rhabdochlamydiaceae bacterium]
MIRNVKSEENSLIIRNYESKKSTENRQILAPTFFRVFIKNPFVEVFQAEMAFSSAYDAKPILASYGAGPCIIMAGYNSKFKAGFIAHFSCYQEVICSYRKITQIIKKYFGTGNTNISLFLSGGIKGCVTSENIFRTIKSLYSLCVEPNLSFSFKSNNPLHSETEDSKSLALDTRSGEISTYDPLQDNPVSFRKLTHEDVLWAQQSFEQAPALKIIYPPTNIET